MGGRTVAESRGSEATDGDGCERYSACCESGLAGCVVSRLQAVEQVWALPASTPAQTHANPSSVPAPVRAKPAVPPPSAHHVVLSQQVCRLGLAAAAGAAAGNKALLPISGTQPRPQQAWPGPLPARAGILKAHCMLAPQLAIHADSWLQAKTSSAIPHEPSYRMPVQTSRWPWWAPACTSLAGAVRRLQILPFQYRAVMYGAGIGGMVPVPVPLPAGAAAGGCRCRRVPLPAGAAAGGCRCRRVVCAAGGWFAASGWSCAWWW
jgi:hypothetical protein